MSKSLIAQFEITTTHLKDAEAFYGKVFGWKFEALPGSGLVSKIMADGELAGPWTEGLLFALGGPIYAGTNEIQRNIISERLLGLPREKSGSKK